MFLIKNVFNYVFRLIFCGLFLENKVFLFLKGLRCVIEIIVYSVFCVLDFVFI